MDSGWHSANDSFIMATRTITSFARSDRACHDHWRTGARLVDSRLKPGMCLGSRSGYLGTQEDLKNWGWGEPIVLSPIFNKRLLPPSRPSTITGLNSEWTGLVDWHKSNETRSLIFFLHELTWCQLVIFYFIFDGNNHCISCALFPKFVRAR